MTRLTDDGYVYGDVGVLARRHAISSFTRSFGTDMIIQQKLNHGGPRDLFIRPVAGGEPINLTASWDLEPDDTRNGRPTAATCISRPRSAARSHLFRVAAAAAATVEQVTKGERRLNGLTIDRAFKTIAYTVGLHDAPADVYTANIDGTNERQLTNVHGRVVAEIAFSKAERLRWPSYDGTPIEGWLTLSLRLRRRQGTVSADRHQSWRPARGDRLQLRLQEAVLRRERLLRPRHQLPQLHRLWRRLQVGDLGRMGQEGRRRRRRRASTTC